MGILTIRSVSSRHPTQNTIQALFIFRCIDQMTTRSDVHTFHFVSDNNVTELEPYLDFLYCSFVKERGFQLRSEGEIYH